MSAAKARRFSADDEWQDYFDRAFITKFARSKFEIAT
jgi:hypothetical protein